MSTSNYVYSLWYFIAYTLYSLYILDTRYIQTPLYILCIQCSFETLCTMRTLNTMWMNVLFFVDVVEDVEGFEHI